MLCVKLLISLIVGNSMANQWLKNMRMKTINTVSWVLFYVKFALGFVGISLCAGLILVGGTYVLDYTFKEVQSFGDYLNKFELIFFSFSLLGALVVAKLLVRHAIQNYKEKKYRLKYHETHSKVDSQK